MPGSRVQEPSAQVSQGGLEPCSHRSPNELGVSLREDTRPEPMGQSLLLTDDGTARVPAQGARGGCTRALDTAPRAGSWRRTRAWPKQPNAS